MSDADASSDTRPMSTILTNDQPPHHLTMRAAIRRSARRGVVALLAVGVLSAIGSVGVSQPAAAWQHEQPEGKVGNATVGVTDLFVLPSANNNCFDITMPCRTLWAALQPTIWRTPG